MFNVLRSPVFPFFQQPPLLPRQSLPSTRLSLGKGAARGGRLSRGHGRPLLPGLPDGGGAVLGVLPVVHRVQGDPVALLPPPPGGGGGAAAAPGVERLVHDARDVRNRGGGVHCGQLRHGESASASATCGSTRRSRGHTTLELSKMGPEGAGMDSLAQYSPSPLISNDRVSRTGVPTV